MRAARGSPETSAGRAVGVGVNVGVGVAVGVGVFVAVGVGSQVGVNVVVEAVIRPDFKTPEIGVAGGAVGEVTAVSDRHPARMNMTMAIRAMASRGMAKPINSLVNKAANKPDSGETKQPQSFAW